MKNNTESKLHIERLEERNERELTLINSGAIFQTIERLDGVGISDVELAMILGITVARVRNAIAQLAEDNLVKQTFQGDWVVGKFVVCSEELLITSY